jgi:CRP-like cAMP-binding protein
MYLIHPDSRYRLWWDMLTAFYVLYLIWLVPFSVGFDRWYPSPTINNLNVLIDGWFIVDVILNFRTGYVDHGVMVLDSERITKNYLQSYFIVDFMASFPWESVFASGSTDLKTGGVSNRKSLKLFKYFKLPKLMRISRMIRFFNKYARFYGLTLSVVTLFVAVHFCACLIAASLTNVCSETEGYYFNATSQVYYFDDNITNVRPCIDAYDTDCETHLCASKEVYVMYYEAIFMAMSMMVGCPLSDYAGGSFTKQGCMAAQMSFYNATSNDNGDFLNATGHLLGSMDDDEVSCPPTMHKLLGQYSNDNWHFATVTMFMFLGVTQISMLIGHLSLMLQSKYQASAAFRMKLDRIKAECEYYKVPWDLQNRVFAYYDYLWVNQKQYDDKILLMNDRGMSSDLRGKLALFLYKDVIQGVSLFERVDDTFLSKICMELQTRVYLPQDWVILKGDIGSELYIISRGVVQVFVVDPMEEIADEGVMSRDEKRNNLLKAAEDESIFLRRGNFFGEVSLLMETRRTTSVQARTVTELNVLVQEVFEEILRESPEFAEEMKNLVLKRKLHNASTSKKRDNEGHSEGHEGHMSGVHAVSLGSTASQIEAAVVDAIESRQLLINMRHAANFDEQDYEDAEHDVEMHNEEAALDEEEEVFSSLRSQSRSSFIKPIQDQIDKDEAEAKKKKKAEAADRRSKREKIDEESDGDLKNEASSGGEGKGQALNAAEEARKANRETAGDVMDAVMSIASEISALSEQAGGAIDSGSSAGGVPSQGSQGNGHGHGPRHQHGHHQAGSSRNIAATYSGQPRLSHSRMDPRRQLRSHDSSRGGSFMGATGGDLTAGEEAAEEHRVMQDVISMQIATLQERTDKVFAMLTTKLGRVR